MKKKMLAASAAIAAILPVIHPPAASAATNSTIGALYTTGAGSYNLSGTVLAVLNSSSATSNTFSVSDGTGAILAFNVLKTAYTATQGDSISFTATNSPFDGSPELSATGFTLMSPATAGTAPTPAVLTIPQFNATGNGSSGLPIYSEGIVTLDNVSFATFPASLATNTTYVLDDVSGDTTDFYGYKSDSLVLAAVNAANTAYPGGFSGTYDITGYDDPFFGVPEIYPTSITQISSSAVPEPASLSILALGAAGLLSRRRRA